MNESISKSTPQWEALHLQIQDLLAGYVDQELDVRERALVEAHLAGCPACRQDVARQQLLHRHLGQLPGIPLSLEQHQRLDRALAEAPPSAVAPPSRRPRWRPHWLLDWLGSPRGELLAASSGWGLAFLLLAVMLWPGGQRSGHPHIPMVQDVLAEYAQVTHSRLPKSPGRAVAAPPAIWPRARLLASWKTTIGGAAAQAFALRSGNSILLQFRVSDDVFFNNPKVRTAIASKGKYETREESLKVLALPLDEGGLLMVGPERSMPASNQLLSRPM